MKSRIVQLFTIFIIKIFFLLLLCENIVSTKIESITRLGRYNTIDAAYGVAIINDTAYVADRAGGLLIIDISDPSAPTLHSHYSTPGLAWSVFVANNIAYVAADDDGGLQIIDVSNSLYPTLLGSYDFPSETDEVIVSNNIAYVADWSNGLQILDVTNPQSPILLGGYVTSAYACGIAIDNNILYLTAWENGLLVFNISNPSNPILIGTYDTFGSARYVTITGNTAYVADYENGLLILDVSKPSNITPIGSYNTSGEAYGVSVVNDIAYLADGTKGLQVFDVANSSNPVLIGSYEPMHTNAYDVKIANGLVYLADYDSVLGGLIILNVKFSSPNSTEEQTNEISHSLNLPALISSSSLFFILLIFILFNLSLLYSSDSYYSSSYLVLTLIGILNFCSDIMLLLYEIIYLSNLVFLIISLCIFILSIAMNYYRTSKWTSLLYSFNNTNLLDYISNYNLLFNRIVNLSIIIHPSLLYILKCNFNDRYRFPITKNSASIHIQCTIFALYSLLPSSIILYIIAFSFSMAEWDIFIWIILSFKVFNQVIDIIRAIALLYVGGGKTKVLKKPLKYGVLQTVVQKQFNPELVSESASDSKIQMTTSSSFTETESI